MVNRAEGNICEKLRKNGNHFFFSKLFFQSILNLNFEFFFIIYSYLYLLIWFPIFRSFSPSGDFLKFSLLNVDSAEVGPSCDDPMGANESARQAGSIDTRPDP